MKRTGLVLLLLLLVPFAANAQQSTSDAGRRGGDSAWRAAEQAKRDSLQREIANKFLKDLTHDLKLDAAQRAQVERVLQESGERKRELSRATGEWRGRNIRALRADNTSDADFQKLIADYEVLRVREHDLWKRDQEELARILTPRQRIQFLFHWEAFQAKVRSINDQRMREQRGGGRPHSEHE